MLELRGFTDVKHVIYQTWAIQLSAELELSFEVADSVQDESMSGRAKDVVGSIVERMSIYIGATVEQFDEHT